MVLYKFAVSFFLSFIILFVATDSYSQKKTFFVEPEVMIGKNVANYKTFPSSGLRTTYVFNVGRYHNQLAKHEHRYYNFPHTGVSISYTDLGNDEELGQEISLIPFIVLDANKKGKRTWHFKFGLGGSYFTRYYDEETNPGNKAIGSRWNWTFQAFLYHTLWISERYHLKVGGGYLHSSNAHTQLPNFGLNSAMASLSCSYYFKKIDPNSENVSDQKEPTRSFLQVRSGLGMHEFGSTIGPVGGPKKPVFSYAISYGRLYNQQLKIYSGFMYRYYTSFYQYLKENAADEPQNIRWESSNINFFVGCEYLLGHAGMNIEGGINLYKPFYDQFYELFENGNRFNQFRMSLFTTRMGLNLYLINTNKVPKHNLALGGHVNANFGKADFAEVSLTFTKVLK